MPLHRATHDDAPRLVDELEAEGYSCQIDADEAGVYIMASKPTGRGKAPAKETRG